MKKLWTACAALLVFLTACGSSTDAPAPQSPNTADAVISFTDMAGREVRLEEAATRIIALTAADCEIVYALGAGDRLIARGEYCDWPAEVMELPAIQSGSLTNIEEILALSPDVVVMGMMDQTVEQVNILQNSGIQVVMSDADDIAGTYEAIEMIGTLLGKDAEAAALVADMKTTFNTLAAQVTEGEEHTIYFEVSPLQYGLWAAGADTFMNEIAETLGLTNIFADVSGWCEVSEEQILERAPDFIVTTAMSYDLSAPTPKEEILSRAGWQGIPAVASKRILNFSNNELTRPGPRLTEGAKVLFDFVYG